MAWILGAPVIEPPGNAARSREAFQAAQYRHFYRARHADAGEVVAQQVDDHQVFGAVLGAAD